MLKGETKMAEEFKREMRRFLPEQYINKTLEQEGLWEFITYLIEDLSNQIQRALI